MKEQLSLSKILKTIQSADYHDLLTSWKNTNPHRLWKTSFFAQTNTKEQYHKSQNASSVAQ